MREIIDLEPDKDGVFKPVRRVRVRERTNQAQTPVSLPVLQLLQGKKIDTYQLIGDIELGFQIINDLFFIGSRIIKTLKRMK